MPCRGADTFLAEASGGDGRSPIPTPAGHGAEDSVDSGSVCLLPMEEASMDRHHTTMLMVSHPIHTNFSKT
jgi:hypothetical protein